MLDPVPATIIPYYGPWTIVDVDGSVLSCKESQTEAIRVAKELLCEGSILAIDASSCVIRFVQPRSDS